jgi:hypothetical protein
MATVAVALVSIGVGVGVGVGVVPAGATKHAANTHGPVKPAPVVTEPTKLTRLGHARFWECPAKTTSLLVGVNQLALHPGQTLRVYFIVKNQGPSACDYVAPYASVAPGPTTAALHMGPCGSMAYEIEGAHHRDVWPGVEPYACPALGFAQLQPGADVEGSGTWDQSPQNGAGRIQPGRYTLIVQGLFSFPLRIEAH